MIEDFHQACNRKREAREIERWHIFSLVHRRRDTALGLHA